MRARAAPTSHAGARVEHAALDKAPLLGEDAPETWQPPRAAATPAPPRAGPLVSRKEWIVVGFLMVLALCVRFHAIERPSSVV